MIFILSILENFYDNIFSLFYWTKTTERNIKRENKNTYNYKIEGCFKSCQKIIVLITFLLKIIHSVPFKKE